MSMALSQLPAWLWRSDGGAPSGEVAVAAEETTTIPRHQSRGKASTTRSKQRRQQQQRSSSSNSKPPPSSSSRRRRRTWMEMREVDAEFDMVLVPPDGCCMSASDSDDSDWSIGWLEPHSSAFLNKNHNTDAVVDGHHPDDDDDNDSSFAVLVPCYGSSSPRFVSSLTSLSRRNAAAEQRKWKHVEQWLSSSH